ncbi:hypothetical protein IAQ61_007225 [Plenodomus lingam]|uniref:uncharacterized protein n=1 Tax=Leptosphaeria maculans TaxID=5022 RepID=UPI0033332458|nr:hypothetical protein IAQ61_007225 [Plenodomus lingam]
MGSLGSESRVQVHRSAADADETAQYNTDCTAHDCIEYKVGYIPGRISSWTMDLAGVSPNPNPICDILLSPQWNGTRTSLTSLPNPTPSILHESVSLLARPCHPLSVSDG